ncbi:hypothetical protein MSSIH_2002 [Methanosarcina siciliae HI350]|uniref:Uncharacterized protein n=1 Tax=Methanosarcina siciliae HI350 TaxID=1434119 RepID=A0A0E3PEV0_9EURY|nr:hypothetical protein [Methanosarcina siciliae]AKB32692.1 hypothetical protein MSSIH_2002 [Methanosarcina siciliae HI350]
MADIKTDREALLTDVTGTLDYLRKRISAKRFNVREGDTDLQGFIRLYFVGAKIKADMLKDADIDEIKDEIKNIKEWMKEREIDEDL